MTAEPKSPAEAYADELDVVNDAQLEGRPDTAATIAANANDAPADEVAAMYARMPGKTRGGPLSADMRVRIARAARAAQAKRSLAVFFKQAWEILEPDTQLDFNWHHQLVCDVVQGMLVDWLRRKRDPKYKQRARNVVFNLPPGSGKSRLISVIATAWFWIHCPSWSVLCLSANPDVATRDASLCRDLVTSDWYVQTFGIRWTIRDDIDAKGKFKNTAGGERQSRGITSKVVGNRTDALLIDDPNDMYDVQSESSRREINSRFDESIYNRLKDLRIGLRFMIQQRGHEDDLTGHWTRTDPGTLLVALPLEFDPERRAVTPWGSDPRKAANDNIHAERYTDEVIEEAKRRLGTIGFEGQYNQRPGARGGNLVKRSHIRAFSLPFTCPANDGARFPWPTGCSELAPFVIREKPMAVGTHWTKRLDLDWWILSVDATFGSTSDSASNVGLLVWAGKGANRFLFEDRSAPMTFPATCEAILAVLKEYPTIRRVLVEKRAAGGPIIQTLTSRITGLIPFEPKGSKEARFHATSPQFESGNVYLLVGGQWVKPYVEEVTMFPKSPKNDRVDATSQLLLYAEQNLGAVASWEALSS